MSEKIFRQKALSRISSPEDLNDTICVTNPTVWLLLASILLLLLGACFWGIFGRLETTAEARFTVQEGKAVCEVETARLSSLHEGMTIHFDGADGTIIEIRDDDGDGNTKVYADAALPDGIYNGKIVTQSINPFFFIIN